MAEKDLWDELEVIRQNIKMESGAESPFLVPKDKLNDYLKDIQGEKIVSIKRVMDEINTLIEERRTLSKQIIEEVNSISAKVDSMLNQAVINTPDNYREKLNLREKQLLIEETKVRERVECWRDIASLKRELRERIKEFTDQESKISVMDKIISQQPK